jgi:hypothetical protein
MSVTFQMINKFWLYSVCLYVSGYISGFGHMYITLSREQRNSYSPVELLPLCGSFGCLWPDLTLFLMFPWTWGGVWIGLDEYSSPCYCLCHHSYEGECTNGTLKKAQLTIYSRSLVITPEIGILYPWLLLYLHYPFRLFRKRNPQLPRILHCPCKYIFLIAEKFVGGFLLLSLGHTSVFPFNPVFYICSLF